MARKDGKIGIRISLINEQKNFICLRIQLILYSLRKSKRYKNLESLISL